ncbi:hypothetical protein BD560DRAFT_17288 [Blakeslea trispora]|nr:hypothetical protein BD560DRAFT_17288 [Blakeslea trispora]
MSKVTVSKLVQQWGEKTSKRIERPSSSQISKMIKAAPDSLEAKLATNPYAAMLASPLRRCAFHSRIIPSSLLLRFELGWHPETKLNWAFPTVGDKLGNKGFGYYVRLNKDVVEVIQKGSYNAVFRGKATYRPDMVEHVESKFSQLIQTRLKQYSMNSFDLLKPISSKQWLPSSLSTPMGYQCILSFDSDIDSVALDHSVMLDKHTIQHNVPCYPVHRIVSPQQIDKIKSQLDCSPSQSIVLGVPKLPKTTQLASDLWRYYCLYLYKK